jgi:hypothetical protein
MSPAGIEGATATWPRESPQPCAEGDEASDCCLFTRVCLQVTARRFQLASMTSSASATLLQEGDGGYKRGDGVMYEYNTYATCQPATLVCGGEEHASAQLSSADR